MAEPDLKMKPSPFVKGQQDPTHTSYEFSLPYYKREEDDQDSNHHHEQHDDDDDDDGSGSGSGGHGHMRSPRSRSPEAVSSSPHTMESQRSDPASQEAVIAQRARGLAGKYIDEFGNVLNWDGTVLGCVHGDLPSMIGRPVSESGYILDPTGEIVGYVSENFVRDQSAAGTGSPHLPLPPREIDRSLRVDEQGNILDVNGEVVGTMKDHTRSGGTTSAFGTGQGAGHGRSREGDTGAGAAAAAAGTTSATPSPSEVYLDVKSTHDGIQLVIKIPTVFNPNVESER